MTGQRRERLILRPAGVNSDLPATQLDPNIYSDVYNMEAYDIGMRQSRGNSEVYPGCLFPPEHLAYNKDANLFYWLYASGAGMGVTDGVAHFDITPTPGPSSFWPANWTEAYLNTIICLNNAVDPPWYWNGLTGSPMESLPGWPAGRTCNALRAYKNNLIALGTYGAGGDLIDQILWSQAADPGSVPGDWTPLPTNDAGDNVLADTIGALLDATQFRDSMMIFKEHSTYLMNFIGGNFVFNFRKLFTTSGLLTQNCAAEYLGNVFVLTDGDFIRTDGVAAESVIDKRMRSFLFNNIDTDSYKQCYVVPWHSENQVWCCFPESGETECTMALVWDATDNNFGVRQLEPQASHIARGQVGNVSGVIDWDSDNLPWDSDPAGWNQSLFNPTEDSLLQADRVNSDLYAVNQGVSYAGADIYSRAERIGLDFGDNSRVKLVKAMYIRLRAEPGTEFTIRVGSHDNDSDPVNWSPPVTWITPAEPRIPVFAQGRYIAYSIESSNSVLPWVISGIEFEYDWQGYF